ncbi:2-hydroxyacid dehydrogenase [Chitinolyticbacter albus]|uniref:2-hydroxyacid dehydrogenase n=1 Tax=Chitinolyticbacter albus TaxID=2961951 RepID=UPI00210E63AB|nr:glyoxylate/hydroxypyruvate reductase A [Chitinolyticbacter albus]
MLYLYTPYQREAWLDALRAALPDVTVAAWPDPVKVDAVRYLAAWRPPEHFFAQFPALKAVFTLGAGVDRFVERNDLASHVAIVRLTDAGMVAQMAEYVLYGVLRFQRDFDLYAAQQHGHHWLQHAPRSAAQTRVTVLGLGEIGGVVATRLATLGYVVSGWSRGRRALEGVACHEGLTALEALLEQTDILVNLLPSTPRTRSLLDGPRLSRLPAGAAIIHAGRGDQLDLDALVLLLDADRLRGAVLDVFPEEPLPPDHPLWRHPKVLMTPHVAATTLIVPAAQQIADKLAALHAGGQVAGLVDREQYY